MEIIKKVFDKVLLIKHQPFTDDRGFFMRTFDYRLLKEMGINNKWVQENHSHSSKRGVLRGLHFIKAPYTDAKLLHCIRGEIYDVIVDLRKDSRTFGNWCSFLLSEKKPQSLYIPKGFAHGFCTLTDKCDLIYKHDSYYKKNYDSGIVWNDKELKINWPIINPIISKKDSNLQSFKEFKEKKINLKY